MGDGVIGQDRIAEAQAIEKRALFVSLGGVERARSLLPLDPSLVCLDCVLPGPEAEAAALVGGYDLLIVDAVLFADDPFDFVAFVLNETGMAVAVLGPEEPMTGVASAARRVISIPEPVTPAHATALIVAMLQGGEGPPESPQPSPADAPAEPSPHAPPPVGPGLTTAAFQKAFSGATRYAVADMIFDPRRRRLLRPDGGRIALSEVEFQLLCIFIAYAEEVLTPARISAELAATTGPVAEKSVAVQVSRLRTKLGEKPGLPDIIQTVRRQGYVLVAPVRALPDE